MSAAWSTAWIPTPRIGPDTLIPDWSRRRSRRVAGPLIRPVRPGDERLIDAMSADVSVRSLYQRYFTGSPRIPRETVRRLAGADHDRYEAVLAMIGGRAVGFAEYVRRRSSTGAELAVLVADPWQRQGIARLLVTELAALAAACGVTYFSALVLPENEPALRAVATLWPGAQPQPTGDGYLYELPVHRLVDDETRRRPVPVRLARHGERWAP